MRRARRSIPPLTIAVRTPRRRRPSTAPSCSGHQRNVGEDPLQVEDRKVRGVTAPDHDVGADELLVVDLVREEPAEPVGVLLAEMVMDRRPGARHVDQRPVHVEGDEPKHGRPGRCAPPARGPPSGGRTPTRRGSRRSVRGGSPRTRGPRPGARSQCRAIEAKGTLAEAASSRRSRARRTMSAKPLRLEEAVGELADLGGDPLPVEVPTVQEAPRQRRVRLEQDLVRPAVLPNGVGLVPVEEVVADLVDDDARLGEVAGPPPRAAPRRSSRRRSRRFFPPSRAPRAQASSPRAERAGRGRGRGRGRPSCGRAARGCRSEPPAPGSGGDAPRRPS